MTQLASAYLQRARESGDPSYYTKADGLVAAAQAELPADADLAIAEASLALSRHDFATALDWGTRATALGPAAPTAYGVLVDALVELGRYDEATAAAQVMTDMRPDLSSYSRISYLRELYGDLNGAIAAMRLAIQAGPLRSEATAWCDVQLGNLYFALGDLDLAERAYGRARQRVDGYAHGYAGLARVRAARGDLVGAAALYERAVARLPLPDYVGALGDVQEHRGDTGAATRQYGLVDVERRLFIANGVRIDADLALFDADHARDLARAVDVARARRGRCASARQLHGQPLSRRRCAARCRDPRLRDRHGRDPCVPGTRGDRGRSGQGLPRSCLRHRRTRRRAPGRPAADDHAAHVPPGTGRSGHASLGVWLPRRAFGARHRAGAERRGHQPRRPHRLARDRRAWRRHDTQHEPSEREHLGTPHGVPAGARRFSSRCAIRRRARDV